MEEVTVNTLEDGMRTLKVISDGPIDAARWQATVPEEARESVRLEAARDDLLGIQSLVMRWPVCEAVDVRCEGWPKSRRMLVRKLLPGQRVSEEIGAGKVSFFLQTGFFPRLVFLRRMPKGAENGMLVDGVMLMEAEWATDGCLFFGGYDGR